MARSNAVLVTGGAGYIGSHCCKALSEAGYIPVCFDNLSTGHRAFVKWGPFVEGDLHDSDKLDAAFAHYRPAAVMHFAAVSSVGESVRDPGKYYANNVAGTLSLLQAMRRAACHELIFSSTGAVYGNASGKPIREGDPCHPVNPYGQSKLMIEQMLFDFRQAYNLISVCFRYFNASGADLAAEIGEFRDHETHLIPRAMMSIEGQIKDFSVFGGDYDTPDGTAVRDYVHVVDLATAHLSALKMLRAGGPGGLFNLGTGHGYSVTEILRAIEIETGVRLSTTVNARRPGDPAILVADPSAARDVLRFKPMHSDLVTIVSSAWKWHRKVHAQ